MSTGSSNIPVVPLSANDDFAALRSNMIAFLQTHNTALWTDYNYHDPGVTILEQFCFALTDLAYRTGFEMADLLQKQGGDAGNPFPGSLKLLNSFPVTKNDIRKIILDSLPKIPKGQGEIIGDKISDMIYNAWIAGDINSNNDDETTTDSTNAGTTKRVDKNIYPIEVQLTTQSYNAIADDDGKKKKRLEKDIQHSLGDFRGLCTDFGEVKILEKDEIKITGNVNIKNGYIPEKVLADIYTQIDGLFNPGVPFYTLNQLLDQKTPIDSVYEGPALSRGFILDTDLTLRMTQIDVSKIRSIIFKTAGVIGINDIKVNGEDSEVYVIGPSKQKKENNDCYPLLKTALIDGQILQLSKNGAKIAFKSLDKLKYYTFLSELNPRIAKPSSDQSANDNFKKPGNFRDVSKYYSMQKYFPTVYGIGDYGLPGNVFVNEAGTDTPQSLTTRKAQANQLKAYLMLFEQLFGNYLSQLAGIDQLFAADYAPEGQTYFWQPIIDNSLKAKSTNVPNGLDILLSYDDYTNNLKINAEDDPTYLARKEMFLDHLLARVNETVDAYPFLLFDSIYPDKDKAKRASNVLTAKARYLKEYGKIGYERNKAFNYYAESLGEENISGLERKIALLLGIADLKKRNLHKIEKLSIVDATKVEEGFENENSGDEVEINQEISEDISITDELIVKDNEVIIDYNVNEEIEPEQVSGKGKKNNRGFHFNDITSAGFNAFFRDGISLANYKVVRHKNRKNKHEYYVIFFKLADDPNSPKWIKLHTSVNEFAAKRKLSALVKYVREANLRSEGFHLLEHVLLRNDKAGEKNTILNNSEPYRITVVLPIWPARFQDPGFQDYLEQLFTKHAPIYVQLDFIWLDIIYMKEFEEKYFLWLKSLETRDSKSKNKLGDEIAAFLKKQYQIKKN